MRGNYYLLLFCKSYYYYVPSFIELPSSYFLICDIYRNSSLELFNIIDNIFEVTSYTCGIVLRSTY